MAKILDNISILAEKEGITIGALERQIGASKGVLSRAINNGTDIQAKWLQVIVDNFPHISAEWLLTGRGEMLKNEGTPSPQAPPQIISELLTKISDQAEEIGRLKAHIDDLQRRRGDNAGHAQSSDAALTG